MKSRTSSLANLLPGDDEEWPFSCSSRCQAKQARAIQAKALQRIIEDGFRSSKDAADAYFKAVQEERVIRGEPSDRLNFVQEQMIETGDRYEIIKELLKDEEFRKFSDRVLEMQVWARTPRLPLQGPRKDAVVRLAG